MAQPRKRQRLMTQEEAHDDASSAQSAQLSPGNPPHPPRRDSSASSDTRNHLDSHKRLHSRHSSGHHALGPRQDISVALTPTILPSLAAPTSVAGLLPTASSLLPSNGDNTGASPTSSTSDQSTASADASAALNVSASATPSFPPLVNLVISAAFLEHSLASNPSATSMLTGSPTSRAIASPTGTGSVRINTPIASSSASADDLVSAMGFPVVPSGGSVLSGIFPSTSLYSTSPTQSTTFATSSIPSSSIAQTTTTALSSSSSQISSTTVSESASASASTGSSFANGGAASASGAGASSATPSTASLTQNSKEANAVSTPVVVGSVVGGLAGLCVLLVAALVFLRWYRKRRDSAFNAIGAGPTSSAGPTTGPEMTQRSLEPADGAAGAAGGAGAAGAGAAGAAFMRRLSRPRQIATTEESPRSFERVSGRKLPSQFSPGMESAPTAGTRSNDAAAAAAVAAAYPSGVSSQYTPRPQHPSGGTFLDTASVDNNRDDPFADPPHAIGIATTTGQREPPHSTRDEERYMPGPARTPILHQGQGARTSDQAHLAARQSSVYGSVQDQNLLTSPSLRGNRPSYIRSTASYDSARSSRFTEDV